MLGKLQNSLQFWDREQHIKPSILSFIHSVAGIWASTMYQVLRYFETLPGDNLGSYLGAILRGSYPETFPEGLPRSLI